MVNYTKISSREKEILKLIAKEYTSVEIAHRLYISPETVRTHRKRLIQKMDVRNSTGLVIKAIKMGMVII